MDRGHGRTDVRTIKTLPPNDLIRALFPHVEQVFLVERYSYAPDGAAVANEPDQWNTTPMRPFLRPVRGTTVTYC